VLHETPGRRQCQIAGGKAGSSSIPVVLTRGASHWVQQKSQAANL
jgi:hypothetical protein